MGANDLNLFDIFKQVTGTMKENQQQLNEADDYNHDHGDHMVEIFEVITEAMKEKKSADPADQLEYAADLLRKKSQSGSADMYVKGLKQASKEFTGKSLDLNTILPLIQMLLGGGLAKTSTQSQSGGLGDLLGSLLGGASSSQSSSSDAGLGDLLGSLVGGSSSAGSSSSAGGLGDLLGSLMGGTSSDQSPSSNTGLEALSKVLVGNSEMGSSKTYRAQSSELVTNTVLKVLSGMLSNN